MTCIVGKVHNGTVWLGGDTRGADYGFNGTQYRAPKVFINGAFAIGYTSSFRMGQILQYSFFPPKKHADDDLLRYMVAEFVPAVRAAMRDGAYSSINSNVESGGEFLVGTEGRLFVVQSDFSVLEPKRGYSAAGCGEQYALGALRNVDESIDINEQLKLALETAAEFSVGVGAPFDYVSI